MAGWIAPPPSSESVHPGPERDRAQSNNKSSVGVGVVVVGVVGAEGVGSCMQYGSAHRLAQSPSQEAVIPIVQAHDFPRVEGGLEAHDPPRWEE